jgi:sugar phosphate isomerase/epimerase
MMKKLRRLVRRNNGLEHLKFGQIISPNTNLLPELKKAKKLGSDYAEIVFETKQMPSSVLERSEEIKKVLDKNGLFATVHMPYWIDLGSEYATVRMGWLKECMTGVKAASAIGARKFLVHARMQGGMSWMLSKNKRDILNNMVKNFKEVSAYASRHGLRLVIENEPFDDRFGLKDMAYIMKKVDAGFALDTGHAFISGNGKNKKLIKDMIRQLGKKIEHIHFGDNNGLADEHLAIGKGSIDYKMVVRELKKVGYGSKEGATITFEVFNSGDRGFKSSLKRVRKMWK